MKKQTASTQDSIIPAATSAATHELPAGYHLKINEQGESSVVSFTGWRGHSFRLLNIQEDDDGYLYVRVTIGSQRKKRYIHRMVCFNQNGPKPAEKHEACHIDGNKKNNHPSNLRWGTQKENADDRERHGRTSRGEKHSSAIRAVVSQAAIQSATL